MRLRRHVEKTIKNTPFLITKKPITQLVYKREIPEENRYTGEKPCKHCTETAVYVCWNCKKPICPDHTYLVHTVEKRFYTVCQDCQTLFYEHTDSYMTSRRTAS